VAVDSDTVQDQNQGNSGGGIPARSTVKGSVARIYAPRPFTPPSALTPQGPAAAFPLPDFKTPSLPLSKSADGTGGGLGPGEINMRSSTPTADAAAASNLFRSMSSRPQDEVGAHTQTRRPLTHQSFFGQFSFDSAASSVDDSGYYSSVSEQNDHEGDQIASAKRNVPVRHPTTGGEVYMGRNTKMQAVDGNPDFDADFAKPTKRSLQPASPGDDVDIAPTRRNSRSHDIPKRLCVRRSPSRSHGTLPRATALENASAGGTQTFILPPHVPQPTAAIGDLPGLEFSEADLGRYAELYEQESERWSKATMEEWLAGANDIMVKFTEMIDLVSLYMFCLCLALCMEFPITFPIPFHRSRVT
jgi:hypothetical protein